MEEVRAIPVDLNTDDWTIPEARAYRKAVGVNAIYAKAAIQSAIAAVQREAREAFGDSLDVEGWSPPDGWTPSELLKLDSDYLLGFAWIATRRSDPELGYEAFAESLSYGELVGGFWAALLERVEEATSPLGSRAKRRKTTPRSRTASKSASPSAGPSETSTN